MANETMRYDPYWQQIDSANMKKVIAVWGGASKMRKDESIAYLLKALNDEKQVDAALNRMRPYDLAALGILKLFGSLELRGLSVAIRVTGTAPSGERYTSAYGDNVLGRSLMERCIIMGEFGNNYSSYYYGSSTSHVFADERILARVTPLQHDPLPIAPAESPSNAAFRRPQSVALDVIAILRAVESIGGIALTKTGELRVNEVRKFARKMNWNDSTNFDGLNFPNPGYAFLSVLSKSGLLASQDGLVMGTVLHEDLTSRSTAELARALIQGMLAVTKWSEETEDVHNYWFAQNASTGRLAVLTALRCLPSPRAWLHFADFERVLFTSIGEHFSVESLPNQPYIFHKSPGEERELLAKWREELRVHWVKTEVPWLQAVFKTWLYAFGLVDLSLQDGKVERFRLTDLGYAVLWGDTAATKSQPEEAVPAWIVQPNFDVVVYLDSASTQQISFLEQHAARVSISQHTVQYRLTRDSVYEGLQTGGSVEELLEALAKGSRIPLPSNVVAEINTWAALRERITLQRKADLLEFPNAATRQSAIEQGLSGRMVADRYLLLSQPLPETLSGPLVKASQVIDYMQKPVPGCLEVTEKGTVTLIADQRDLLTVGYLNLWAQHDGERTWQLTRESVTKAAQRGRTLAELLSFLRERVKRDLPGLLTVALRAWTGESIAAGVGEIVVLQCLQTDVLDALFTSSALKPYLLGSIGPDTILVKRADVPHVRAILDWAGIQTADKILTYKR